MINDINKGNNKVSVIMPSFNSSRTIRDSINSVLNQKHKNLELIIIDDCSKDNSLEVIKSFADERIILLSTPKNSGAAVSRNLGILQASGRYIAFLDSDDLWDEEKLTKQIEFMEKNNCPFSYTNYKVFNEKTNSIICDFKSKDTATYKSLLWNSYIGCLTVCYDTFTLGKVYMPENAIKKEDYACWLSILKKGFIGKNVGESLATYRISGSSVSSSKAKMAKYQWFLFRKVEKINPFKSFFLMISYTINGLKKYK